VTAELHLAEDAFALHLFLQRLEGLINIVVSNENLHAVLSPSNLSCLKPGQMGRTAHEVAGI
jgi:hypothetical protein